MPISSEPVAQGSQELTLESYIETVKRDGKVFPHIVTCDTVVGVRPIKDDWLRQSLIRITSDRGTKYVRLVMGTLNEAEIKRMANLKVFAYIPENLSNSLDEIMNALELPPMEILNSYPAWASYIKGTHDTAQYHANFLINGRK